MMRIAAIIVFTLTALVTGASAQEPYPSRPISIVNPFPPGGIADLTARPLAASFERLLKQFCHRLESSILQHPKPNDRSRQ